MNKSRNLFKILSAVCFLLVSLTACTSKDETAVSDTAMQFLSVVASDSTEDISKYATSEVANGDFVQLFDSDSLATKFVSGATEAELSMESKQKVDEFCDTVADMIKTYSISNVEISKDGKATAIATIKTSFPMDIINSDSVAAKIDSAIAEYNTTNAEEIATLYEEDADGAQAKIFNDMLIIILDIYEDEIASSNEMTYAIAIDLEKNPETDTWIVTDVKDYDSSAVSTDK